MGLMPARIPGQSLMLMEPTYGKSYIRKPAKDLLTHDMALTKEMILITTMSAVSP